MLSNIPLKPRMSEKSYELSEKGTYVFDVPLTATKITVKNEVEKQYKVTVEDVRTIVAKGKTKRIARKRSRPTLGKRKDIKKAYVTLKSGDRITVFPEAS